MTLRASMGLGDYQRLMLKNKPEYKHMTDKEQNTVQNPGNEATMRKQAS